VQFVNPSFWNVNNISARVEGEQTNVRAELYAILMAIYETRNIKQKLVIRTDSELAKNCIES